MTRLISLLLRPFWNRIIEWLTSESESEWPVICDFDRVCAEIKPCDVVLIEGTNRVSEVIKLITQSAWSHAALYIGRLEDIKDPELLARITELSGGDPNEHWILEAQLGEGTHVSRLSRYQQDNIRICRPTGLSETDTESVIAYVLNRVGNEYDVRQILDLARFMFPLWILPRRWRSTLFEHHAGRPTRDVCSSLIAEAFMHVNYPILPMINRSENNRLRLRKGNPRLFTPRDFDYSPYFEIVKYPLVDFDGHTGYRHLPWEATLPGSQASEDKSTQAETLAWGEFLTKAQKQRLGLVTAAREKK
ncbi:MAG TPA: hypothetical protein DCZ03_10845 [Gammaproteobacteria bacterium]|nr:hypothetical protein [Gammaproteobacteria bacterium]